MYKMKIIKNIFIAILLLCSVSCKGQQNPYYIDVSDNVTTTKTTSHTQIDGTRIFMVMPEGFKQKDKSIFEKTDGSATINIMDIKQSVNTIDYLITQFELKEKTNGYWKQASINDKKAYLGNYRYNSQQNIMFAVVGNDYDIVMISITYFSDKYKDKNELKDVLLSLFIDDNLDTNSFRQYYSIDLLDSRYKYAKHLNSLDSYFIDGVVEKGNKYQTSFYISTFPMRSDDAICSDILNKHQLISPKYDKTIINGREALVVIGEDNTDGHKAKVYDVVIKGDDILLRFMCIAYNDIDASIEEFKKIASTLRLKEQGE